MQKRLFKERIAIVTIALLFGASVISAISGSCIENSIKKEGRIIVNCEKNEAVEVWVDDDYYDGGYNDGHTWGYDAFNNIQEGITAVIIGGTVHVLNGIYYENIVINKVVNLVGEDKTGTALDGGGINDVVSITVDQVNISGFTVVNSGSSTNNAGINILSSNNTIMDCEIYMNYGDGIRLISSSGNTISYCNVFSNGDIFNPRSGIVLFSNSENNIITNCDIQYNSEGIDIDHSSSNNVINCTIYSNVYRGIYIDVNSESNVITNSDMSNNGWGIIFYASYNTVSGCIISSNDYGICTYGSNNTIKGCDISNNDYGISIHSSYNTIKECDISFNDYGIYAYSSHHDNNIYHNNFVDNTVYQAYDSGSNIWDDDCSSGGNYWSDFDEPVEGAYDNNSDGIIDLPYNISGGSNQDKCPLSAPWMPYLCGDLNNDDIVNIGDLTYIIAYLYGDGLAPSPLCLGDLNNDDVVNIGDLTYIIAYLYGGGPAPDPDCCNPPW